MTIAEAASVLNALALYLAAGVPVGLYMAFRGAATTDHAAAGAGLWFRLAILPGAILLWPYMVGRLLSGRRINAPIEDRQP
ncbi:MAG: hypothetical protein HXY23_10990 [Parvularculaceae bacterium]|nr:hypothetical protein [Parvularculaceae bacterium]